MNAAKALLLAVALAFGFACWASEPAQSPPPVTTDPPYLARGKTIEARHNKTVESLKVSYDRLKGLIERHSPEHMKKLHPEPPAPAKTGYGLLPKITPTDLATLKRQAKAEVTESFYSWSRVEPSFEVEKRHADALEQDLKTAESGLAAIPLVRPGFDKLIETYHAGEGAKGAVENLIRYNRDWQSQIAADRARFDVINDFYKLALERRDVRAKLALGPKPKLQARERELTRKLNELIYRAGGPQPGLVRVGRPQRGRWVLEVTVHTDIVDAGLLRAFETAIEKFWRVQGGASFEIDLRLRGVALGTLYPAERPNHPPHPKVGDAIDVRKHVERFPKGGMVLTTGAGNTFFDTVGKVPFIALSPVDVGEITLAHEFGHVLGLHDAYFRGYRDLGTEGYEVIELIPDLSDIMCAPGAGLVQRHHFVRVLRALGKWPN